MLRLAIPVLAIALCAFEAKADPLKDERYVDEIKRDAKGQILRRADVLVAFKKIHPCPSTGKSTGACRGWSIDHVIPLACGGLDGVSNLQWLPNVIKVGWQDWKKDSLERKIYAVEGKESPSCKNEIVIITDKLQ